MMVAPKIDNGETAIEAAIQLLDSDPFLLAELIECSRDWAQGNGICMRLKGKKTSDLMENVPFTLFPTPVEKFLFDEAYNVQKDMNLLYHRIAFDYDFICQCLRGVVERDDFTKRLLDIYTELKKSGNFDKTLALSIVRSDYMFHRGDALPENGQSGLSLKQIEMNTISCSFAALSSKTTEMHKNLLRRFQRRLSLSPDFIPPNEALGRVSSALVSAWRHYQQHVALDPKNLHILFVIEEVNRNIMDQRAIEDEILCLTHYECQLTRLTLRQCDELLYLDPQTRRLLYHGPIGPAKVSRGPSSPASGCSTHRSKDITWPAEIAVVYYRAGYVPEHYPTESEWTARALLERSAAFKCPWIGAHLAGTKKVQQVLADPKVLAGFFEPTETSVLARIRETFANLYGLEKDDPSAQSIIKRAMDRPELFVLKPQLEGGGHNFYGSDVKIRLQQMTPDQRQSYILMQRLNPKVSWNVVVGGSDCGSVVPSHGSIVSSHGTDGSSHGFNSSVNSSHATDGSDPSFTKSCVEEFFDSSHSNAHSHVGESHSSNMLENPRKDLIDPQNTANSSILEPTLTLLKGCPALGAKKSAFSEMVDELGIFGCFLSDGSEKILQNFTAGHLLRTKSVKSDEGGVMAGASALNSPYLT